MDGICDVMLEYNIHKERKDSNRFAKGMSTTFQTLHGLVDKGVKVDLGIPYDLWDKPSAEITNLKTQCEDMMEKHEADIEQWYYHHQQQQYIIILNRFDQDCLIMFHKIIDDLYRWSILIYRLFTINHEQLMEYKNIHGGMTIIDKEIFENFYQ